MGSRQCSQPSPSPRSLRPTSLPTTATAGGPTEALTLFSRSHLLRGLLSLETMETASKREKNVGRFRCSTPPAAHPTPQLHVCPIPIPSHPVVCIIGFVFSPRPLFLFAFKIMKLCCGPCLSFTSSCSPWWCMGEVGK